MTNKYECKIVKGKDGHTRAECKFDDEDNYMIVPDFGNFPEGGLAISRQFGPNETDEESDKNVHVIVIEKRDIVDRLKDFLNSTRKEMVAEHIVAKDFDIIYRFEKEYHGWLRAEATYKQGGKVSIVDILIHKDVVPSMKMIINQNFIS